MAGNRLDQSFAIETESKKKILWQSEPSVFVTFLASKNIKIYEADLPIYYKLASWDKELEIMRSSSYIYVNLKFWKNLVNIIELGF